MKTWNWIPKTVDPPPQRKRHTFVNSFFPSFSTDGAQIYKRRERLCNKLRMQLWGGLTEINTYLLLSQIKQYTVECVLTPT